MTWPTEMSTEKVEHFTSSKQSMGYRQECIIRDEYMNEELWIMAQLAYLNKKSKNDKWQKQMKAKVTVNMYCRLEKRW